MAGSRRNRLENYVGLFLQQKFNDKIDFTADGEYSCVYIGRDIKNGEHLQYVVPGGVWFASRVKDNAEYSLLGCTVSPGFDFADFILPNTTEMTALFPQHSEIISELTRD